MSQRTSYSVAHGAPRREAVTVHREALYVLRPALDLAMLDAAPPGRWPPALAAKANELADLAETQRTATRAWWRRKPARVREVSLDPAVDAHFSVLMNLVPYARLAMGTSGTEGVLYWAADNGTDLRCHLTESEHIALQDRLRSAGLDPAIVVPTRQRDADRDSHGWRLRSQVVLLVMVGPKSVYEGAHGLLDGHLHLASAAWHLFLVAGGVGSMAYAASCCGRAVRRWWAGRRATSP
jgi:hypothetical protein